MGDMPTIDEINAAENVIFDLPDWQPEYAKQLGEKIIEICIEAKEKENLNLSTLRCISVREAEDFAPSVHIWQRALGLPEIVTSMESGAAAGGKSISWKTSSEEVRSGIVVSELIAAAIVQGIPLAKAVLIHELTHVHDEAYRLSFDAQQKIASAMSIAELSHDLSYILWSEFLADRTALPYYSEEDVKMSSGHSEIIAEVYERHSKQKTEYRLHGDNLQIWQETLSATSIALGAMGRFLGQYSGNKNSEHMAIFRSYLPTDQWIALTDDALGLLEAMHAKRNVWNTEDLKTLDSIVQRTWNEFGVQPEQMENNVYIRVP